MKIRRKITKAFDNLKNYVRLKQKKNKEKKTLRYYKEGNVILRQREYQIKEKKSFCNPTITFTNNKCTFCMLQ